MNNVIRPHSTGEAKLAQMRAESDAYDATHGILHAIGAYGRTATKEDWTAGKDFKCVRGPYFSVRDTNKIRDDGYHQIQFWNLRSTEILFSVDLGDNV